MDLGYEDSATYYRKSLRCVGIGSTRSPMWDSVNFGRKCYEVHPASGPDAASACASSQPWNTTTRPVKRTVGYWRASRSSAT